MSGNPRGVESVSELDQMASYPTVCPGLISSLARCASNADIGLWASSTRRQRLLSNSADRGRRRASVSIIGFRLLISGTTRVIGQPQSQAGCSHLSTDAIFCRCSQALATYSLESRAIRA